MTLDERPERSFDRSHDGGPGWRDPLATPVGREGAPQTCRSLELARRYMQQRGTRRETFGADVFREPAWDVMLDLYCARLTGKEVSMMDACIAAGVPSTTGLRYVRRLLASKLVTRRRDVKDRRRSWVALTDQAAGQVERWLHDTWPELPAAS